MWQLLLIFTYRKLTFWLPISVNILIQFFVVQSNPYLASSLRINPCANILHPTMQDLWLLQFNWRNSSLFLTGIRNWCFVQVTSCDLKMSASAHHGAHSFRLTKNTPYLLHLHSQQSQQLHPVFSPCRLACSDNSAKFASCAPAQPYRLWAKTYPHHISLWKKPETLGLKN